MFWALAAVVGRVRLFAVACGGRYRAGPQEQLERLGDALGVVGGGQVGRGPAGEGHARPRGCGRGPGSVPPWAMAAVRGSGQPVII